MIEISNKDIPEWLKRSDFYDNLNVDDADSKIEIPADCFRGTDNAAHSAADLTEILKVMRFWGVHSIPDSVLAFCFTSNIDEWDAIVSDILGLSEQNALRLCFEDDRFISLKNALLTKRPEFVAFWLFRYNASSYKGDNAIVHASKYGTVDLIKALREKGFAWDTHACCAAAYYGQVEILQYLHENGCPWDEDALVFAARGGQVECMKYLHTNGCAWTAEVTMEYAVSDHHHHVKNFEVLPPCLEDYTHISPAKGYIECLRYALAQGCPIHDEACNRVCKYGLLDCLALLHQCQANWDEITTLTAAGYGHVNCLQYLHENGCRWDTGATQTAACCNMLDCLKYLHEHGCPWDADVVDTAAQYGHYDCLVYALENGCVGTTNTCYLAAAGGHVECLVYLHEQNCPWDEETVTSAAVKSHIDCLRYAIEQGCPYDTSKEDEYRNLLCSINTLQLDFTD